MSEQPPYAVYRFHVKDGALVAVAYNNGGFECSIHYIWKDTKLMEVRRVAVVAQGLEAAITDACTKAGLSRAAKEIATYIRATEWGGQWPVEANADA